MACLTAGRATPLLVIVSNDRSAFRARLPLVAAARASGFRVEAVLPPGEPIGDLVTHDWSLQRKGLNPWTEWRSLRRLRRLLRRLQPDVVHLFTIKAMVFGGLATRRSQAAAVHTVTGLGYAFIPGGPGRTVVRLVAQVLLRRALRGASRVMFQNQDDKTVYLDRGLVRPAQAVVVPGSGVDVTAFDIPPPPPGPPVVAFLGRLLADKGVGDFVAAARILRTRGVPCRSVLVGDIDPGNRASIDAHQLAAWRAEGVVEAWGWRPAREALAQASIVCLPSYREGIPRALLEAAAACRPVVTTDAPGCRDAVVAGTTGLLVPVRDPVALADAIEGLVADPRRRKAMGKAGRRLVEQQFAMDRVNQQVIAAYRQALGSRSA